MKWISLSKLVGVVGAEKLIGRRVRVVDESHGWGGVDKGQEGVLTDIHWDGVAKANIEGHGFADSKWIGKYHCFEVLMGIRPDEEDIL
jgi:hypothetical protein